VRINVAVPEAHVTAPVLDAALESVTRLNEAMLEKGEVPTFEKGLMYGIKWRPEPPGQEHFDHAREVIKRKWGDCDDLAPWHAASLRHTGHDPEATAVAKRVGPDRWHAVVRRGDGTIDDPSKRAGMGTGHPGIIGATQPLMYAPQAVVGGAYVVKPQIAVRPVYGAWQARADLPWYYFDHKELDKPKPSDYAMTALHTAPVALTALTGAIDGVIELGECAGFATEDDIQRLSCVADACSGVPMHELADMYAPEHVHAAQQIVGSFFSRLRHMAQSAVSPLSSVVKAAVPFIPGVGPVVSPFVNKGLDLAQQAFAPGAAAVAPSPGGDPGGGGGHGYTCRYF
jgi:hypothetical protein